MIAVFTSLSLRLRTFFEVHKKTEKWKKVTKSERLKNLLQINIPNTSKNSTFKNYNIKIFFLTNLKLYSFCRFIFQQQQHPVHVKCQFTQLDLQKISNTSILILKTLYLAKSLKEYSFLFVSCLFLRSFYIIVFFSISEKIRPAKKK